MCASGGSRLKKFLCNNKKVLQSIPKDDKRAGIKDKNLVVNFYQKILLVFTGTQRPIPLSLEQT